MNIPKIRATNYTNVRLCKNRLLESKDNKSGFADYLFVTDFFTRLVK